MPCNDVTCGEGYVSDGEGGCVKFSFKLDNNDEEPPNECEWKLIKSYKTEALSIYFNVSEAKEMTVKVFGKNGLNDCSDAFRHSYFNLLNTLDVGANLTRAFGVAHECNSKNELEINMDLHNNDVGISVATSNPNLTKEEYVNILKSKLMNGDMKILSNLGTGNQVTNNTKLINSQTCDF